MRRSLWIAGLLLIWSTPALAQRTFSLDTANECGSISVEDMGTAAVQVTGISSATVTWTVSVDGSTFVAIDLFAPETPGTAANSTTSNGVWAGSVAGLRALRACVGASGSALVTLSTARTGGGSGGGGGGGGGEVTNAGTFAVQESGGALTALQIIDDWDESDRAKVNPIAGQAGVAAGSGTVSATTQRVVLATDVALPAGTNNIGDVDLKADVGGTSTTLTAATEGSFTGLHTILIDPATNAAVTYAGACTPGSLIGAGTVNETEIKDTAGFLDWIYVSSLDATPVYLKLYDIDNDDLDENDTPIARIMIPANATAANGAGATTFIPAGMTFSTAISFRVTTGLADNSTGALTANEVLVSWCYR